jgi:tetratricopeptide (TPR) repeat protein
MKRAVFFLIPFLVIVFNLNSEAQISTSQEDLTKRDTLEAQLKRAQLLTTQSRFDEALKIYTGIIGREPDNRDAVQGWFIAKMRQTSTGGEGALKLIEDLGKSYPDNTAIIFWKSFIEAETGQFEAALTDIEKLAGIFQNDPLIFILKGQVLYELKRCDEAFHAFDKATLLDSERWDVWGMKALSLAKIGKFDEAIISINKGMELAPSQPANIYNRACIYCLKGDKTNALSDLQKAISLNPAFKENARKDEDFTSLYDDEDFKKLTL